MTNALRVPVDDAFSTYALEVLGRISGVSLASGTPVDICYGENGAENKPVIPKVNRYTEAEIPGLPTPSLMGAVSQAGAPFPFDIFTALRFWLCDEGHQAARSDQRDAHNRLIRAASVQGRKWSVPLPIVNAYGLLFRRWIEAQFNLKVRPRRARVVLTHDVDDPLNPGDLGQAAWIAQAALRARTPRATLGQIRALPRLLRERIGSTSIQHWNFAEIVALEAKYGFRSVFFFASTPWWWPGAHRRDVTYDVRSPKFRKLFKQLHTTGAEVGLHMSYNVHSDSTLFKEEKERLELASGRQICGGRHHYWHLGFPIWSMLQCHGDIGLGYDTSLGFNEEPGYRLGIGQAFFPWNPLTQSSIPTLQIPTLLMDGAILYDDNVSAQSALRQVDRLLDTVEEYECTVSIDWHVRTSFPGCEKYNRWAEVYEGLLERLSQREGIDVVLGRDLLMDDT